MKSPSTADSNTLADRRELEDILDILVLTQSPVDEAKINQFTRLSNDRLKTCLDFLIGTKCLRAMKSRDGTFYESTPAGNGFLKDNFWKVISRKFVGGDFEKPIVSVVIPAFNEENSLGSIVWRTSETLQSYGIPFEIVVIDDGSTDSTAVVASVYGATLIKNGSNRGKGHALQLGFEKARGSYIVTMDADGSHRPEEIPKLLYPLLSRNLRVSAVIGSRFIGKIEDGSITKLHLLGNRFFDLAVKMLTGVEVSDTQSGFRAFRRDVIERMTLHSLGFEIETEMIIRILKERLTRLEVPITCRKRQNGDTKLRSFSDGFRILRAIIQTSFEP